MLFPSYLISFNIKPMATLTKCSSVEHLASSALNKNKYFLKESKNNS